ncbi:glycosyltransferase family 2 protein [Pedosphaera parvula]|nr:glycosyltransferase [Pedosphaera parvula]
MMNSTGALCRLSGWRKPSDDSAAFSDCTLIVPTYRRPKEIVALLNLLTTLPDVPGEVVVVDGSPEDSVNKSISEWANAQRLQFDLVYVKSPPGLTRQRNVGLDVCSRSFIFFLDDDCLPEPGYFGSIRQVFAEDVRSEIGAVRGFLTNGINKPLTLLWRLRYALKFVPRGEPGQYHACGTSGTWDSVPRFNGVRKIDVLAGGASAYRREVFQKHRFSEFFYGYAQGEDLEMSRRIARDWKLVICGDALVDHHHQDTGGRPSGFPRGRMAVRNRYFIWKRHSPEAGMMDCIRFWGDHLLIFCYYLLGFCRHPSQGYYLSYTFGTLYGAIESLITPPHYEEPPAKKEFEVCFTELKTKTRSDSAESLCAQA